MGVEAEFQKAVYAVLAAAPLGVVGVYDTAPQAADGGDNSAFPYITFGATVITNDPVDEAQNFSVVMRINTHVRGGSMLACKVIQGAIYTALHDIDLSVTGFNCYSILRENSDCLASQDGKITGVCEYRALLQAT